MSQKLKQQIDRMVEDSIRRILPSIMNEVLLKTIANANVIQETRQAPPPKRNTQPAKRQRPTSLSHLLDESAGADFYQDPHQAMMMSRAEEEQPKPQVIAQRIQSLPPALQGLVENIDLDDDGGEMWDSQYGDAAVPVAEAGPPLDRAAAVAGIDFNRMAKTINVTEKKTSKVDAEDRRAQAQFEAQRLKRMREQLNGGKPIE